MNIIKSIILTGTALLLFTQCGSDNTEATTEIAPIKAKVAKAEVISSDQSISVSGKIEATNSANLSTRMMGNITSVKVKPGDKVSKGTLLLTLSTADLTAKKAQVEASIAQAESAFQNAENDFNRFKTLFEKGSASEKELENIKTRYEMAKAGLTAAKQMENEVNAQFAYTNISAPFNGVVANTFVKVGDIAHPGMPLVTVEGTANYEAAVLVSESQISDIKVGDVATVLIKSAGKEISGVVREVSPSAKNTGGQFIVKINLETKDKLLPGMFVNASINTKGIKNNNSSPLLAKEAIFRNGQLTGIYTLSADNKAILRYVRIGEDRGDKVEVLSGISEGETYILTAEGKLYNGATILANL
ncbi:MAG: efflux RND transporter periplasmic adaptor subunit [Fulvivirga sp.]|uniref:efflux RND transporter periplasmic adaptor subunit n=1 Tax=Fulvivirga sp. TaxID=1931237 RepID=UPI0032EF4C02